MSVSPDGSKAVATFTEPSLRENSYRSWVEVYDLVNVERLYASSGPRDVLGRWSAGGSGLYYLRVCDDGAYQLKMSAGSKLVLVPFDRSVVDYKVRD